MREINIDKEKEFENSKVLNSEVRKNQNKYYDSVTFYTEKHKHVTYNSIKDKIVLEIGCSSGYDTLNYAQHCKKIYACDLSDEAIQKAKSREISNAIFVCCDAHKLPYDNNTFDYVIVNSLLHHLDLNVIFKEIKRVLINDGYLIFKEPLGTNPIINIYRLLTPESRTPDERPFNFNDLKLFSKYFQIESINFYGFSILLSAFKIFKPLKFLFSKIDDLLSNTPMKYFFWMITGVSKVK